MKTIKQWIEELPEPYKTQAFANADKCKDKDTVDVMKLVSNPMSAISSIFYFWETPEGGPYWQNYIEFLSKNPSVWDSKAIPTNAQLEILGSKKSIETQRFPDSYLTIDLKMSTRELAEEIYRAIKWMDGSSDSELINEIEKVLNQRR